jgi:choline dehydrogenase
LCQEGEEPSDSLLEDFALHFSLTVYHPTSTCQIGDVVGPRLRLNGVERLRVADTSLMPAVIGGNKGEQSDKITRCVQTTTSVGSRYLLL